MDNRKYINANWQELRRAINAAWRTAKDERTCLRDYAENISMTDAMASLLGRETANERQHRRNHPSPKGFSVDAAAKLILMNNVVDGIKRGELPASTMFLELRQTAVEAQVIGYLVRDKIHPSWIASIELMDYAKLMQSE